MALAPPPAGHPSWGRWSQAQEYSMMPENQNMMVYSRPPTPDYVNRQVMVPQYMTAPYSSAQVPAMTAAHYTPAQAAYAPYPSPPQMLAAPASYAHPRYEGHSDGRPPIMQETKPSLASTAMSPSSSRDSHSSTDEKGVRIPEQSLKAKIITANATLNPQDRIDFHTDVDELMKAIQVDDPEPEERAHILTPAPSPKYEEIVKSSGPSGRSALPTSAQSTGKGNPRPKKYICNGPSCNKSFSQKTHLEIHRRTHSGQRPYICDYPGCGLTFSQLGNLKTHKRRHTGDKPFKCSKCDKTFAQRGNVKSHEETHEGLKPYVCILDKCGKRFSQLGNMKTHQNNFHKAALQDLTNKFANFLATGYMPEEYRTLIEYFKAHYKNSNKGIKGRGKARKIAGREPKSGPRPVNRGRKTFKPASPMSQPISPAAGPMYPTNNGPVPSIGDHISRQRLPGDFPPPVYHLESHPSHMMYEHGQPRPIHGLY